VGLFKKAAEFLTKSAIACVASFLLFVGVSYLHAMFGAESNGNGGQQAKRVVVAEIIKKEKQEQKQQQQRIRQVHTSQEGGKTGGDRMAMRFTPDLGLDAGPGNGAGVELANQELAAEVFEEGKTEEDAEPEYTPRPEFPGRAREQAVSGTVDIAIVINHAGRVVSVDLIRATSPLLFTSDVRKVVMSWRFKPAKNKGVPVSVRVKQTIDFTLD
jgi:TonB family protein